MITLVPEKIEDYAAQHSTPESEILKALVKETYQKTEYPQMQVGHLEGAFLRLLVRLCGAKRILEIGEEAAAEVGIYDIPKELLQLLAVLRWLKKVIRAVTARSRHNFASRLGHLVQ